MIEYFIANNVQKYFQLAFKNDIQTALDTDDRQKQENSRTTLEKVKLYFKRFIAWTVVLTMTGGFVFGIYELYINAEENSGEECPSFDNLALGD